MVGGSSGTAMAAALKFAQRLDKPKHFVVLFPDTGRNYLSKIYSDEWMREQGFAEGVARKTAMVGDVLAHKKEAPFMISVRPRDALHRAVGLMHQHSISQIPVIDGNRLVGSLNEASVMKLLYDGIDATKQEIAAVMGTPLPTVEKDRDVSEAHRLLLTGSSGLVVTEGGAPRGVITRTDLINYWLAEKEERHGEI